MKRIRFSIVVSILMMLLLAVPSHALDFTDTPQDAWYHSFVSYAYNNGWIQGYGNGMFGPNDELTYAQAITIIVRSTGLNSTDSNDTWYAGFVEAAYNAGYINKEYNWNEPIPRLEMANIIINAYDIEPSTLTEREKAGGATTTSPFIDINNDYISSLYEYKIIAGIITENGLTFQPEKTLTRAEICTMLTRLDTHPLLSEKIRNKDFFSNDYTTGYEYFLDRKLSYNKDCGGIKNIVDGLLYMVTNDLYEVTFDYYDNIDNINEKADEIFDIWNVLSNAYPEYFSIYYRYGIVTGYENKHYTIIFSAFPREQWTKPEAIGERVNLFKMAKSSVEALKFNGVITPDMSETDRAHAIATWIVNNAQYDTTFAEHSHYGTDFYRDKTLVCEGYTTLFNTMLKFSNINAYGVFGTSKGGNHMWTIHNLDGVWKYTDVTHMDPIDFKNPQRPYFNDEYFNKTEEEMLTLNNTRTTNYDNLNKISTYQLESWKN